MILRNFLDEKVFFLQVAIVLACFPSEKSQNKLDLMHSFLLKHFTKLVKMNLRRNKAKKSHRSNFSFSLRAHVAKFYGRLRLICSVLRASKFAVLKLIEIVILWVYYTIPFCFIFFRHFWDIIYFSTFSTTFFG